MRKLKIGLAASRIAIIGNYMLRRPKYSTIEIVAPKEEEECQNINLT
jgi:UTP-glucose-1-phosphate uridylyltransferase